MGNSKTIAKDILAEQIEEHLINNIDTVEYIKSKEIAAQLDLQPKQVGRVMGNVGNQSDELSIEKWSRGRATTWKVQPDAD